MTGLETRLLAAHAKGDRAALSHLYNQAADAAKTPEARGFFLTQAWVFALDAGLADADVLGGELKSLGRL